MSAARPVARGLIFDLDGTLVDAFTDIAVALNQTRTHYGLPPLPEAEVRREVGSGSAYLVRTLVPVPAAEAEAALAYYLARYEETALAHTRPMPGAQAVLEHFRGRPLAVVTNKPLLHSRRILEGLGLWPHFRIVLGGDSLPRCKPDPLPVQHVLACFGLPPGEVVLVGDGLHDIHAGQAAGVRTVAVTTGVTPRATLAAANPDHLVESLEALAALFA